MRSHSDRDVKHTVSDLVRAIMADNAILVPLRAESRLADIGLTSMDMVNLMLAVEAEFDVMIPQADITPEHFQSVEAIQRLVIRLRRTDHEDPESHAAGPPNGGP
jgi:acyl carrier protein